MNEPDQTDKRLTRPGEVVPLEDCMPPGYTEEDLAGLKYMLSLSPGERLQRNEEACRVTTRLDAIALKYGLRSIGWKMCGPSRAKSK